MEDAFLGLAGGGSLSIGSILYTMWQSRQNTKDIEECDRKIAAQNLLIDVLNSNLANFKLHAAETFADKDDIREYTRDIKDTLRRIEDKLDNKVDKT